MRSSFRLGRRGRQLGAGDVEEVELQVLVQLQATHQKLHGSPRGLQGLEMGIMQQGAHPLRDRQVGGSDELGLLRTHTRRHVGRNEAPHEGIHRRLRAAGHGCHGWRGGRRLPAEQSLHGRGVRLGVAAQQLRLGLGDTRGVREARAEIPGRGEERRALEQPIGVEGIEGSERDRDRRPLRGVLDHRGQACEDRIEGVEVDAQRWSRGERRGVVEPSGGAPGKVPEQKEAHRCALHPPARRGTACDGFEIDLQTRGHFSHPQWVTGTREPWSGTARKH